MAWPEAVDVPEPLRLLSGTTWRLPTGSGLWICSASLSGGTEARLWLPRSPSWACGRLPAGEGLLGSAPAGISKVRDEAAEAVFSCPGRRAVAGCTVKKGSPCLCLHAWPSATLHTTANKHFAGQLDTRSHSLTESRHKVASGGVVAPGAGLCTSREACLCRNRPGHQLLRCPRNPVQPQAVARPGCRCSGACALL